MINVAVRPWLQALVQWHVRRRLPDHGLALAEERELPGEAAATASIIAAMSRFTETTYAHRHAERAGNTKTYGVARAELTVADDLPDAPAPRAVRPAGHLPGLRPVRRTGTDWRRRTCTTTRS